MKNKTKSFYPTDRVSVDIPDPLSASRALVRQNEYKTRILGQLLFDKSRDYKSYFLTLTYNDGHLPHFQYEDIVIPCHSRKDISNLFHNIKQHICREYSLEWSKLDLTYILCSEVGETTYRPHYHMIFSAPAWLSKEYIYSLFVRYWADIYGFICPRRQHINGDSDKNIQPFQIGEYDTTLTSYIRATGYVCKYCSKDIGFYRDDRVKDIIKRLSLLDDTPLSDAKKRRFKSIVPFVRTSMNFGECLNVLIDESYKGSSLRNGKLKTRDYDSFVNLLKTAYNDNIGVSNLFKGFSLGGSKTLRLTSYNKRCISDERYLTHIEKDYEISDEYVDYILKGGLPNDKDCPPIYRIGKKGKYKGVPIPVRKYTYSTGVKPSYASLYHSIWVHSLNNMEKRINEFYMNDGKEYDGVIDARSLAIYIIAYKDRISPYLYRCVHHDSRFDDVMNTYGYIDFKNIHTLEDMEKVAERFYTLRAYVVHNPTLNIETPNDDVLFNSMKCFFRFDEVAEKFDYYLHSFDEKTSRYKLTKQRVKKKDVEKYKNH